MKSRNLDFRQLLRAFALPDYDDTINAGTLTFSRALSGHFTPRTPARHAARTKLTRRSPCEKNSELIEEAKGALESSSRE